MIFLSHSMMLLYLLSYYIEIGLSDSQHLICLLCCKAFSSDRTLVLCVTSRTMRERRIEAHFGFGSSRFRVAGFFATVAHPPLRHDLDNVLVLRSCLTLLPVAGMGLPRKRTAESGSWASVRLAQTAPLLLEAPRSDPGPTADMTRRPRRAARGVVAGDENMT